MNTEPLVRRYGILPLTVALAVVLVGTACRDSGGSRRGEAATPAMISAPAVPLGPQFLVKAGASNSGVAMDSLGRFLVVWSATDAAGPGIFGQRFDASGARRGDEFRLLTDAVHGVDAQKRPSVAMDKDGNFVVAWTTSSSGHDDHDIVAQRFAADGAARGAAFAVSTNTAGTQLSPSVDMGADGNFVVAWTSEAQDGAGVFAQRYYAGGAPLGAEFRVDADVGGRALNPSVGVDALGGHIVVWETALAEGAGYDIVGQRYDAYGNRTGDTFQFVPNTGAEPRFPGVATDTAGNFFVTWADGDDFLVAFDGVFVRRYSAAGAGSGEGLRISGGMLRVHAPRMAIDAAGNSVVVWDGARSADEQAIFARRFRPARPGEIVAASGDNGGVGSTAGSGGGVSGPGPDGMPEDGEPVLAEGGGMGAAKATLDCVTYTPERLYMAPAGLPSSELADALGKLPGGTALSTIITGLAAGVFPIGTLEFDEGINVDVFSGLVSDNERRIEISDAGDTAACNTDVGVGGCARLQIGTSQGGKLYAGAVTGGTNKLPSGAILDNYSAVDYNDAQHRGQLLLAINGNLQQINDALKDLEYAPDPDIDGNGTPYIYNGSNPEKITATLAPNAPKTCTADTSVTWEIEIRVLRVNDFPDLTPDNPVEVAAPVDTEVTVGNAITVPTVIDPGTVIDPDVDEAGPANQRKMLLIGALSCGQPITQDTSHGFHFGSAAFDDIGSGLKDLLILAGIDDTTVLPGVGGKTNSELLIELLDAALPTVDDGTGTQKELSELPLATGNNFDFKSAFGAVGTIGDMQDAVSKIYFQHDKADDTCELLTVVSDLGNWGLPLQYVGSPPTGIEIPLIGFDFNTRVFETQRSATVSGASVTEGNAGTTTVDVTVTLGAAAIGNETLTLSTTGGTATGGTDCNVVGTDYLTLTDAAVTFAAGDTTATVPVTVCGDELIEVDETITVTLADAQNVSIADATGSATITNDDLALVTLSAVPVSIAEAAGTSTVTATLSQASAVDVTVNLALGGSATSTTDYTLATSIVIPANDTSASVTLTAVQDTTDEANESVVINISTVDNATEDGVQQATVTITDDDDGPTVTLSAVPTSIDEAAGTSTITATLAQASAQQVTVNLAVSGTATGGDYTLPLSIVIPPNDTTGTATLTATQDAIDEADETVIVDIDTVINATESASQQVTVTITDDDDPPTVTLSAVPTSIAEAAGTSTITATLSQASGQDVTVNLTLSGTATGGDYTLAPSIVIPAGDTTNSTTLTATQDANDEADETVIIDISSVTNATESGTQQVAVTITDDDDGPAVTLSAVPTSIDEAAGVSTITATLAQTSTQIVTVTLAASGTATGADYTLALNIVIPANTLTGSVTLTATQDATDEADETVVIDIDGVTNGGEDGVQQVTVTITDDDDPPTVTLSAVPTSIAEAAGTSTITATLAQASAQQVTVNLAASGTAAGGDYTLPLSIVIPASSTSASVTLTAVQDTTDETNETVVIDISGVTNGSEDGAQQVTVTITDDDDPPTVALSAVPTSIAEAAGTSTITATLAQASAQIVTVNLAVSGAATSGTDYTLPASIVIPANSTTASITLTAVPDAIDEANEPVVIDISSVDNATEDGVQQVTVTITDDDDGPAVTLSAVPTGIAEAAGTSTITATLSQVSAQDVTVNLAVTGTSDGTDYTLPVSILIPAGSSSAGVTLTAVQDATDEADETVIIDISTVVNATEDGVQQVTVTITDDDGPDVSLSAVPASIAEAAGTSMIIATLAQASAQDVTVNLSASGTAAGGDYTLPASIFIAAGGTTASVMLTAVQDAVDEADETVIIDIASVTNGVESGTQQVTVTITDDDVTTRVASVAVGSVAEGNAGMTMVNATVTLDAAANGNETLTLSTMNGTASGGANCAAGIDYITVAGAAVNFAVGETTQLVPITVCGDSVVEGNETFSVMLGNAVNVNIGTDTANSTISNDDAAPPTATAVPTATATATPTPTASSTPSPSPTPTSTPQPTASPTATPTPPTGVTPTPIPTTSPTPGVTPTPGVSPTAAPTASPSATPTAGPTAGSINSGEGRFGGSFDLLSVIAGLMLLIIRRGRLMLMVLLGGVLLPVPSHAESEAEATARVNLREAPDTDVQVVTVLEAGQRVRILERGPQYTRVTGTTVLDGYLPSQYLRPCADEAQLDCAVTTTVVNVRDGKGIEHALVGRLLPDTSVVVRERDGDYALIHHEAEVAGYVATSYLREIDPAPVAAPDTATPKFSDAEPVQTDVVDANPPAAPAADEPDPLPAPVVAQTVKRDSRSTGFSPRWQLGVAAGSAISELDRSDVQRRFSKAGVDVEVSDYDGQDLAIELFVRYEFTPTWGVQLGYLDLGEFETRYSADPAEAEALAEAAKDEYPIAGDGLALSVRGQTGVGAWRLAANLGVFLSLDRDIEINLGDQMLRAEGPGTSVLIGLGTGYMIARDWQVHADVRALDLNGWIVAPAVGVTYAFR